MSKGGAILEINIYRKELNKVEDGLKFDEENKHLLGLRKYYRDLIRVEDKKFEVETKESMEKTKINLVEKKRKAKMDKDWDEYFKVDKEIIKINAKIRDTRETVNHLTMKEFKDLKKQIQSSGDPLKNTLIVQVAYECGLRVSEIIDLRLDDIDRINMSVLCRRIKGSKTNKIFLTKETFKLLNKYIKKIDPIDRLFLNNVGNKLTPVSMDGFFKRYCKKAGIPKGKSRFHSLKHSRAVHMADAGVSIEGIQQILGHKSVNSTMRYFHFTKKQEEDVYKIIGGY